MIHVPVRVFVLQRRRAFWDIDADQSTPLLSIKPPYPPQPSAAAEKLAISIPFSPLNL
jgi:hypothetical protein